MRLIQLAAVSVVILGLAACARYPLGMSEAEFRALTPEQQLQARTKQADLDVAEERRQAEQLAVQRQERAAYMARFYAGRAFATPMQPWMGAVPYPVPGPGVSVASPYSRVVIMGGQVNVPVGDGLVRTKRDWRPALPEAFILAEGETTNVEIERADGKPGSTMLRIARLNGTIVVGFDQEVYPLVGTYPLEIDGLIRGAAISIAPG